MLILDTHPELTLPYVCPHATTHNSSKILNQDEHCAGTVSVHPPFGTGSAAGLLVGFASFRGGTLTTRDNFAHFIGRKGLQGIALVHRYRRTREAQGSGKMVEVGAPSTLPAPKGKMALAMCYISNINGAEHTPDLMIMESLSAEQTRD